jgi:hypothetical protein
MEQWQMHSKNVMTKKKKITVVFVTLSFTFAVLFADVA